MEDRSKKQHSKPEPGAARADESLKWAMSRLRQVGVLLWFLFLGTVAFVGAFLVRFEGTIPEQYRQMTLISLPVIVLVKLLAIYRYKLYRGLLRYTNTEDLVAILKAATVGSMFTVIGIVAIYGHGFPRSVFIIDYLLTMALYSSTRFVFLFSGEFLQRPAKEDSPGKRTLIIGAGDAGDIALHAIKKDFPGVMKVVGFLDDNPMKLGMSIHGYPILGTTRDAPDIIREQEITEVIIAITAASKEFIRDIVDRCSSKNVNFRMLPTFRDYISGRVQPRKIRGVSVEDLLGREPVEMDKQIVADDLEGKCVLVTGAGGSIGSELVRQIAQFKPARLILVDAAETPLFDINNELQERVPDIKRVSVFADIKHGDLVDKIFEEHRPDRVYHAAAYKHVPLMEGHPVEAVFNNVFGTRNMVKASLEFKPEKFVMISTDKAVRPTSIMGATKRCAELLVASANGRGAKFITVRFGNVLGSTGSVVPIFRKQIAKGGPVKVTHPDVVRYFMTIPEAVELVLGAGAIGQGAEVFILNMGEQVKIVDLARSMIELSGLEPGKDIQIEFTGLRPGEKLYEELVAYGENVLATKIPKVMVHRCGDKYRSFEEFLEELKPLEDAAMACDDAATVEALWDIVRRHDPDVSKREDLVAGSAR